TEAKRNGNRRLELGQSLSAFMEKLGLDPQRGGKRSDARRLRDQMERLFRARISFQATLERADATGEARLDMQVVNESELWWSRKDPNQTAFWGSWVELGEKFFAAITAYPVPADIRALRALKRSPLALDLYSWLTYEAYRAHRQGKPRFENWEQLHAHLGAEYGRLDNFRMKAKAALRKIMTVYPGLRLGDRQGGIQVLPGSGTAIQSCNTTIDGVCKTL
ncbi:MAG: hypothetical protein JOZ17_19315, partial [Acetobacteraceae bacterium]|nr:hypothetical protein [Acetobacteraceae bacterium]